MRPFILAVTGGSASGKTRLAQSLARAFSGQGCYVIPEDDYYIDAGNMPGFDPATFNFDEPAAKDHGLLETHLQALRAGRSVAAPQYDFGTHCRCTDTVTRKPAAVLIVEGLHLLATPTLANVFDLTVYVDASDEIRFERRLARDVAERGRTPQSVRHQYQTLVRPMHEKHVEPQRHLANIVIENMGEPDFDRMGAGIEARIQDKVFMGELA